MIRRLAAVTLAIALALPLPTAGAVAPPDYGDYALVFERSAGQLWTEGVVASQWAWKPLNADRTESEIAWGHPKEWPPGYGEHFVRDGDWLLVNGYFDHTNSNFNTQRVTAESMGDANCADMRPLPSSGGRQHYVRWTIPTTAYCLSATGTIKVGANGAVVNFRHEQIWYPPAPCANSFLGNQTCIRQHERWYDDKGVPFSLSLERDQHIALGQGMGFRIHQTYDRGWPAELKEWRAELRYAWRW
ncbi:hypothetical protein [Crossiella cryophila]|uniref:Uncharacterized protein n=1 Tax=Crossiella cryophila TaxID=43355 RepID=A0A7W7FWS6_9PSEU|nr:hypothetical protein [Crossiella cryophila]MBB4680360.1 hypothetical protein [Crossiella cryophila]